MEQFVTGWRVFNTVLCCVSLFFLWRETRPRMRDYSKRMRALVHALGFFHLIGISVSVEGIAQDLPLGTRSALVTFACGWVLWGLVRHPHAWTSEEETRKPPQTRT